jgi:hypothetical protein
MPRVSIAYRPMRLHLSMDVEVADAEVARALVRALPSDGDGVFHDHWPTWIIPAMFALTFCVPMVASMVSWITIGADGIHLREIPGQRFISFADSTPAQRILRSRSSASPITPRMTTSSKASTSSATRAFVDDQGMSSERGLGLRAS